MRSILVIVVSLLLVVTLEAIYYALSAIAQRRVEEMKRRLTNLEAGVDVGSSLVRQRRLARSRALAEALSNIQLALRTEKALDAADAPVTVAQVWGASLGLAAAGAVLAVAFGLGPVLAVPVALVGGALPSLVLAVRAQARSRKISEQLPEALDMMARSLRAGHAISGALQLVARELPPPVSVEFGRAFEEQRLGLPLEEAIRHMTERAPSNQDLKIFATSLLIQRETGGNLAELLGGLAETIRARYRFRGKLRALTAEGRMSATVLSLVPVAFVLMLQFTSPGYLVPLLNEPRGQMIVAYGLASWLVGVVWLHRMTQIAL
jgi:tight adherence protein B